MVNSVLKTFSEVTLAKKKLKEMGLFSHHGPEKSWDTLKMIEFIEEADRDCFILDVGCNGSPILPMLKRLNFGNLYGCDFVLETKYNPKFMKIACQFYKREYLPILQMYEDDAFKLSIQNLEKTSYPDNMFEYITSLSVIEHDVNMKEYFREMSRILKKGGYLLTSTDYWPNKITNVKAVISKDSPDKVFSRSEIEILVEIAHKNNLQLVEPIDFTYQDRVVKWKKTGLEYTFILFVMKKI